MIDNVQLLKYDRFFATGSDAVQGGRRSACRITCSSPLAIRSGGLANDWRRLCLNHNYMYHHLQLILIILFKSDIVAYTQNTIPSFFGWRLRPPTIIRRDGCGGPQYTLLHSHRLLVVGGSRADSAYWNIACNCLPSHFHNNFGWIQIRFAWNPNVSWV